MRYIDFDKLPRKTNPQHIDWGKSIGYELDFCYDDIQGVLKILAADSLHVTIYIDGFTDENGCKMTTSTFRHSGLATVLKKRVVFLYKVGEIVNHLKILEQIKTDQKYYKYICTIDGYEGVISEYLLKEGISCPVCSHQVVIRGVNDIGTTHPRIASWLLNPNEQYELSAHTHKKTNWKCNVCGKTVMNKQVSVVTRNNSVLCDHCSSGMSYPEKFMVSFFDQLNISFTKQFSPSWAGRRMYDFYFKIDTDEYIVEMDGGFHFIDNNMSGMTKESAKNTDKLKDDLAKEHGINMIRIDCNYVNKSDRYSYIKQNIMLSKLSELFDLVKINFDECHNFACSSYSLQAISLYNQGYSFDEICLKVHIGKTTLRTYLTEGSKSGLCKYDPSARRIPIYCENTGHVFASTTILNNNSEELFGFKMNCKIYTGMPNQECNGYKFKKISKEEFNKRKQESPDMCFGDSFIL